MHQIVGRISCMILLALSAWTWCPVRSDGHLVPDESDRTLDWSDDGGDDRTSDWSIDEDDEDDEDDDDDDDDDLRSAAAAVLQKLDDDVYAGKMMAFFAKLHSLRRKSREDRRSKPESSSSQLEGLSSSLLPPPLQPTHADRDRKSGYRPGAAARDDDDDDDDHHHHHDHDHHHHDHDRRSHSETADYGAGDGALPPPQPQQQAVVPDRALLHGGLTVLQKRPDDRYVSTVQRRRRRRRRVHDDGDEDDDDDDRGHRGHRPAGRLRMGWESARCVWRVWRGADDGGGGDDAARGRLRRRRAREWLEDAARFWAAVVGVSVAVLWAAFGAFHGPSCAAAAPHEHYARDVNRYLNTVPPHVVVTGRGKMFRYRPTVEERCLWKSAKKMAGFRV